MKKPDKITEFNQNLALTKEERKDRLAVSIPPQLDDLERDIRDAWVEYSKYELTALALATGIIRNVKLIRAGGDWKKKEANWDEYCSKHLGFSRQHYQQMESFLAKRSALSAKTQKFLRSSVDTATVVEAISEVPEDKQEEVAEEAAKSGKKVTAKAVKEAAKKIEKKEEPVEAEFLEEDATGFAIPKKLQPEWTRTLELERLLTKPLREVKKMMSAGIGNDKAFVHLDSAHLTQMQNMIHALEIGPYVVHRECSGDGCKDCRKRGYLTEQIFKRLPKEVKEKYGSK